MNTRDIPIDAVNDEIMRCPDVLQAVHEWAVAVFGPETKPAGPWPDGVLLPSIETIPFSFNYPDAPAPVKAWKKTAEVKQEKDFISYNTHWQDPATGLEIQAEVKVFNFYPAVDWVLYFENHGSNNTPVLDSIQALDASLPNLDTKKWIVVRRPNGDSCSESTFALADCVLHPGQSLTMAPHNGRSSDRVFPFFNVHYDNGGVMTAIGWTGQWAASLDWAKEGALRLRAGLEKTHLILHPGERIRSPRILLHFWTGDRIHAHNRFRRLMLFHYVPKQDGRPARLPVALQTFDRYSWTCPEWATEAGQLGAARAAHELGCDTLWFDAAWFPGNFPHGVGNLFHKPAEFPNGLRPIGDACHEKGMRFVVWFEPERVAKDTEIAREHPEFVFPGKDLFKLSDPTARRWLTERLSKLIGDFNLDIYRNDFNTEPLPTWRENDAPDRQGMTEIRYIEGLYEMWDELKERHPHILIDNCASGGRRLDLEMCMRAVPLWRSDTNCGPGNERLNQNQSMGLAEYIPLSTACAWLPETYNVRSAATGGLALELDYRHPDFDWSRAIALLAEVKEHQKYWYGDYYPLTASSERPDPIVAWQLHRPDMHEGLVLAFRREDCLTAGIIVSLRALVLDSRYEVTLIDNDLNTTAITQTGKELQEGLILRLPQPKSSLAIRYRKV